MRRASTILLLACLVGCSDDAQPMGSSWEEIGELAATSSSDGFLSSVWGSSPSDVFVVGGTADARIYHFDGSAWEPQSAPSGAGLLVWVFGFGSDDVYAVGLDGTFLHYDGESWSALDSGTSEDLWGIWGSGPTDIWIVGGSIGGSGEPVLIHYDGSSPELVAVAPEQNPLGARALFKVWGIGGKVFAVGQLGLILEYSGGNWQRISAGAEANEDFISLSGVSTTEIVVVGGRSASQIAVYDGTEFTTYKPPSLGGTSAVFMSEAGEAWIGGVPGYIARFDTSSGTVTAETLTEYEVHAMWGDRVSRTYAVGGIAQAPYPGLALLLENTP